MKNNIVFIFLLLTLAFGACDYAQSNVQTLVTDDCGVSWKQIDPGQSVPKGIGVCHYVVTVPNYPMQGEAKFTSAFVGNVNCKINVFYDYNIVEAKAFISEAKFIGKARTSADNEDVQSNVFEQAENSVIDKRIKNVIGDLLIKEDPTNFDQNVFEELVFAKVNDVLKQRGVQLNFIEIVPEFGEQTTQAIDVATAMKIYKAKQLEDIGGKVIESKAGATKVTVQTNVASPKQEE